MTYSTVAITVFYALTCAAVILLRRKEPQRPRPYRVWGYPWTPWLFVVTMAAFVVNECVKEPGESLLGLGLVALGAIIYLMTRRGGPAAGGGEVRYTTHAAASKSAQV